VKIVRLVPNAPAVRPVVSGVKVGVGNAAIGCPAAGLMVIVPAATEARAVTDPAAAVPSKWPRRLNWKN
jgi:hypothetical protein